MAKHLRDALKSAIESTDLLESDQKDVLTGVLEENSGIVLGLFRMSFRQSLVELHRRADLPAEEERIGEFIRKRNPVLHGS